MYRFLFLSLLLFISGCTPILFGAGATGVAVIATQERTIGKIVDDNTIWLRLKKSYELNPRFRKVTASVNEGRILLTGNVRESLDRIQVSKIAWDLAGVKEVINEVEIADQEKLFAESSWITAQIKFALLMKSHVKSVNYSVETYNGTVYLMGIAQNKDELKRVIDIAQKTPKVVKIVSYVRLKNSDLRD